MDLRERLQTWRREITWKNLLWFLLLLPLHIGRLLLEDRFTGTLNSYIDKHGNAVLTVLAHVARFFLTQPVSSTAILAIAIFTFLMGHAYIETRPSTTQEEPSAAPVINERLDLHLMPSQGPSDKQFLAVKNKGKKQKFHATCRLTARRNDPNPLFQKIYDLVWENEQQRAVEIAHGEPRNLLIATAAVDYKNQLEEVRLIELSAGTKNTVEWSRWNRYDKQNPRNPEYDFEISIYGEGDEYPFVECFTLLCGGQVSALELVKKSRFVGIQQLTARESDPDEHKRPAWEWRPDVVLEWDSRHSFQHDKIKLRNIGKTSAFNVKIGPFSWPELVFVVPLEVNSIHPNEPPLEVEPQFVEKPEERNIMNLGHLGHFLDSPRYKGREPLSIALSFSNSDSPKRTFKRTAILKRGHGSRWGPEVIVELGELQMVSSTAEIPEEVRPSDSWPDASLSCQWPATGSEISGTWSVRHRVMTLSGTARQTIYNATIKDIDLGRYVAKFPVIAQLGDNSQDMYPEISTKDGKKIRTQDLESCLSNESEPSEMYGVDSMSLKVPLTVRFEDKLGNVYEIAYRLEYDNFFGSGEIFRNGGIKKVP